MNRSTQPWSGGRGWRGACAALCLAAVAGCAMGPRLVRTEVTSFNEWSLEYQNSLELQSYEELVRQELGVQGFRFVADPAAANLVVTLRPSVSGASVRVRDPWPDPYFGPAGFYGLRPLGWYGPYWGYGGGFGGFYSDFRGYSVQVFQRRLELDIDSRATTAKRYYEGRVESVGESDALSRVMPILVRALFTDFPGNNGQTRQVDVPVVRVPAELK
jgi:hypothetical protein